MRQLLHCDTVNVSCKLNYMRDDANWRSLKRPVCRLPFAACVAIPSSPATATLNFHLTKSPKSWKQAAAVAEHHNRLSGGHVPNASESGAVAMYQRKISPFGSAKCGKSWWTQNVWKLIYIQQADHGQHQRVDTLKAFAVKSLNLLALQIKWIQYDLWKLY